METLSSKKVFSNYTKEEKRAPYTYKSGAMYDGEWKGGFRHGFGKMRWKDGAEYIGQWRFGEPSIKGKFK